MREVYSPRVEVYFVEQPQEEFLMNVFSLRRIQEVMFLVVRRKAAFLIVIHEVAFLVATEEMVFLGLTLVLAWGVIALLLTLQFQSVQLVRWPV